MRKTLKKSLSYRVLLLMNEGNKQDGAKLMSKNLFTNQEQKLLNTPTQSHLTF